MVTPMSHTEPATLVSGCQPKQPAPIGAIEPDNPYLFIPGQSKDFPLEISSFREPSSVELTNSSWVNLDLDNSRQSKSGGDGSSNKVSVKEKVIQLEKTVAFLQAQLQAPPSAYNAIVELMKDSIPTEVLITTESPHKKDRGESSSIFEPQSDPIEQLPWETGF